MFQYLFDDILIMLLEYMNDFDTKNLMKSSFYIKKLYHKNGYLKILSVGDLINNDLSKFAIDCTKHERSLKTIYIGGGTPSTNVIDSLTDKIKKF